MIYFLYIQTIVLVLSVTAWIINIPIKMILPDNSDLQLLLISVFGIVCEIVATILVFRNQQKNEKTSFGKFAMPCILAYFFHFLISFINGFYVYTAGIGSSYLAQFLAEVAAGKSIIRSEVPIYFDILIFIPMLVLKFGGAFLGFHIANLKRAEEIKNFGDHHVQ